jgi:hypothetical protein
MNEWKCIVYELAYIRYIIKFTARTTGARCVRKKRGGTHLLAFFEVVVLSWSELQNALIFAKMFSPVESQVIVPSKEIPIVNVGLRTAEVPYTNQSKTAWKSEVGQKLGQLFRNISRLYMTFAEKGKVVKSVQPIFFFFRYTAIHPLDDHWLLRMRGNTRHKEIIINSVNL